jgi:predicted dehydrogenase
MKKIAILGCENSHADAFLKAIQTNEEYRDVEVVGVYSNESEATKRLSEQFSVPVLENYADAVGKIDGLVITARNGENHYKYAKPYIESGIPMFIDKPITNSEEDAVTFMKELLAHNVRFCGGSSLKQDSTVAQLKADRLAEKGGKTLGGYVRAPYDKESEYGGFFFYAQHLVEMVGEIFGRHPLSVTARENGGHVHVLFHYEDYDCVGLYCNEKYKYFVSRISETDSDAFMIPSSASREWFAREFGEYYELLSGGAQQIDPKDFIAPVFVMNAIARSLESGKEEAIRTIEI